MTGNQPLMREVQTGKGPVGIPTSLNQFNPYFRFNMLGISNPMAGLYSQMERVAPTPFTVLVQGETGTGKSYVAQGISTASSRSDGPYIPVNCSAIPTELAASFLYGHRRGAFTGATSDHKGRFELADGGTLFLDEITNLSLTQQAALIKEDSRI
jgi:Nif-specific regulatory protein